MNRFVFLDRDGTLVEDHGYTYKREDYKLLPGAAQGLHQLASAGYQLVIVTNQSGIGRGYFTQDDFEDFQAELIVDLAEHDVQIATTLFCPHTPEADCACRKPKPGLLERARKELYADLAASWVIGDSPCDLELAKNAGCRSVLILTGKGEATSRNAASDVPRAANLLEAADIILRNSKE